MWLATIIRTLTLGDESIILYSNCVGIEICRVAPMAASTFLFSMRRGTVMLSTPALPATMSGYTALVTSDLQ